MALIDQVMLFTVFGLGGLALVVMAVWAWVETSAWDPGKARRAKRAGACCRHQRGPSI
jgi:hypothetical protein